MPIAWIRSSAASAAVIAFLLMVPLGALGADGVPVAVTSGYDICQAVVRDGAQGALVAWSHGDLGAAASESVLQQLQVTRLDAWDARLWSRDLLVSDSMCVNSSVDLASDGAGGAYVVWMDGDQRLLVRRVTAAGGLAWEKPTVLSSIPVTASPKGVIPDGAGGAIVAWWNHAKGHFGILAQRVDRAGVTCWASGGIVVSAGAGARAIDRGPEMLRPDGAGGALLCWAGSETGQAQIHAARITHDGELPWGPGGVRVAPSTSFQLGGTLVATPDGGAIVAICQHAQGDDYDLLAGGVAPNGVLQWSHPVCRAPGPRSCVTGAPDGAGGAFLAWQDFRPVEGQDLPLPHVYAQHLGDDGKSLWQENGAALGTLPPGGLEADPAMVADGAGGFWLAWDEMRTISPFALDLRAGHFLASGAPADGTPVGGQSICGARNNQYAPHVASLGGSRVMVGWRDERDGDDPAFYVWSSPAPEVRTPPPAAAGDSLWVGARSTRAGGLEVAFQVGVPGLVTCSVIDLQGRTVRRTAMQVDAGRHLYALDKGELPGAGIYLVRVEQGGHATVRKGPVLR